MSNVLGGLSDGRGGVGNGGFGFAGDDCAGGGGDSGDGFAGCGGGGSACGVGGQRQGGVLVLPLMSMMPGWRVLPGIRERTSTAGTAGQRTVVSESPAVMASRVMQEGDAAPSETPVRAPTPGTDIAWPRWIFLGNLGAGAFVMLLPLVGSAVAAFADVAQSTGGDKHSRGFGFGGGGGGGGEGMRKEMGIRRPVELVAGAGCDVPMTCGVIRGREVDCADEKQREFGKRSGGG